MAEDKKTTVADADDSQSQPAEANVEERLSKLEELLINTTKTLDEERKASAGKDKKITELSEERKKLQSLAYDKDQLLEVKAKELEEAKAEWERQRESEILELKRLKVEQLKTQVLSKLENFPSFLFDRVRGETAEEIELDARNLAKLWVKERDKVDNARKVTGRPQSAASNKQAKTADEIAKMTGKEKMEWAQTASDEEYAAVFDELHSETHN
jgi:hypothetical protein